MIKAGIADSDSIFTDRLREALNKHYPGEIEILYFPSIKKAQTAAQKANLNILLLNNADALNSNNIPKQCRTALLTENRAKSENYDFPAVCKYQSIDEWHTFLLELCAKEVSLLKGGEDPDFAQMNKLCLFTSGGGGVGASAAAAAFCVYCAGKGVPVAYLNFETFSSTNNFFTADNKYTFDEVIYAMRSKKYETSSIISRALVRDESGVDFINPCSIAPDMFELTGEEITDICEQTMKIGKHKLVVADMNFGSDEKIVLPFMSAFKTVLVSAGSEISNIKAERVVSSLPLMCGISRNETNSKLLLLYNQFEAEGGRLADSPEIGKLGGIKKLEHDTDKSLIKKMASLYPFEKLAEIFSL